MCEIITINSFLFANCEIPSSTCPPSSRVSPFCHTAEPFGQGHTHRAHIKRRRLFMPLVALVQNNQSAPATAYKFWCLGFASSSPLLLAFRHATCECLYKYATNRQSKNPLTGADFVYIIISLLWNCSWKWTSLSISSLV